MTASGYSIRRCHTIERGEGCVVGVAFAKDPGHDEGSHPVHELIEGTHTLKQLVVPGACFNDEELELPDRIPRFASEDDMLKKATTFHFTAEEIKALKPDAKRMEYWDARLSGFGLRVTPKGAKTWFYWYRNDLEKRRWTIGRSPQISLADAREKARAAYGKDPAREKVEGRHAQTFGGLCETYIRLHAKPNKTSWKRDEQSIERDLAAWKNIPAKDITRKTVQALLDRIADPERRNAPASARTGSC
jgi:hypothetical protein